MTEMDSASFIETVVTSTRVRLARNLYSYPFPGKMTVRKQKRSFAPSATSSIGWTISRNMTSEKSARKRLPYYRKNTS